MKINNTIRIKKPAINAVHRAPARVNPTAGGVDFAPVLGAWVGSGDGWSGEAGVLLLIVTSLSYLAQNETNHAGSLCSAASFLTLMSAV
jgi:hypothetical protein